MPCPSARRPETHAISRNEIARRPRRPSPPGRRPGTEVVRAAGSYDDAVACALDVVSEGPVGD